MAKRYKVGIKQYNIALSRADLDNLTNDIGFRITLTDGTILDIGLGDWAAEVN